MEGLGRDAVDTTGSSWDACVGVVGVVRGVTRGGGGRTAGCARGGSKESRRAATAIPGRASANTELAVGSEKSNVALPARTGERQTSVLEDRKLPIVGESTVRAALDVDVLPGVPENQGVRGHRTILDELLHGR